MPKVVLKRKEVADKYECNLEKDVMIHAKGYSGMISNINVAGAEAILKDKNVTYLVEKGKAKKEEPKA